MLSQRQELVLRLVAERTLDDGAPVGSKVLAERLSWGPSTIRSELAALEQQGLLDHPHTSAGRVPTEKGYRYLVDQLLSRRGEQGGWLPAIEAQRELNDAMREATEHLASATELLAVITAPPIDTSTVRRVELLTLQPQVLMVVVITSSGGVSKRVLTYGEPIDTGLVDWASSFLNERLEGTGLGERMIRLRLEDDSLDERERGFLNWISPAFTDLAQSADDTVYVDGAARLVAGRHIADAGQIESVIEVLERRVELLGALRAAIPAPDVVVRIGQENEMPSMRSLTVVAAGYGPARRAVGTVSVLGPVRMDYGRAIGAVREASSALSRYVEDVYDAG